jgi:hypothetical protein
MSIDATMVRKLTMRRNVGPLDGAENLHRRDAKNCVDTQPLDKQAPNEGASERPAERGKRE